ncbi:MAG TPA: GatB/YqeY domain-containing protein [Nitrospiria bacterium]|nr:GatB/YqeY domain-containing protein [Nitrospiria bacterium]
MLLQERLSQEMKQALKSGDSTRLSVIRLLRASIKNREIERGKNRPLTENDLIEVVVSAVKQRNEAIEQFAKAGRMDLVKKEEAELKILQDFLPKPLSQEELDAKISEAILATGASGIKDMGKVMKMLMPQVVGRADAAQVSQKVKELLGGPR